RARRRQNLRLGPRRELQLRGGGPMEDCRRTCSVPRSNSPAELSDQALLRRWRNREEDAATELYFRYAHRLRALVHGRSSPELARRVEVEDLVQSVFANVFRGISQGDYDVPDGEELWNLILVIALNEIRRHGNFHRAARRDVRLTGSSEGLDDYGEDGDAPGSEADLLRWTINETLEQLPEQQRQIVRLRMEGHEGAEIATHTSRSKRTVERNLKEFREKLARALNDN